MFVLLLHSYFEVWRGGMYLNSTKVAGSIGAVQGVGTVVSLQAMLLGLPSHAPPGVPCCAAPVHTRLYIHPLSINLFIHFIHALICSSSSFKHSFIHLFVHSFLRSFIRSFIQSYIFSFIHSCTHSSLKSCIPSFIKCT